MKVANIVIFDIETGGFLTKGHENGVCEIAMIGINADTLEEIGRYEAIIAPYKTYSEEITTYTDGALQVNGLTRSQIEGGEQAKNVIKEMVAFAKSMKIGGRNGKPILAGHNIDSFDIPYLNQFFELHKKEFQSEYSPFTLDTMWWTRMKWAKDGSIANHKLGTACESANIPLVDAHRAMADVESNTELVRHFITSMRGDGSATVKKKEKTRVKFQF